MRRAWLVALLFVASCAAPQKRAPDTSGESEAAPAHAPPAASPDSSGSGGDATEGKPGEPPPAPPPATTPAGGSPSPTPAPKSPTPGSAGAGKAIVTPSDLAQAQITFDDAAKAFSAGGTDCLHLCKALGSMQNATNHLCELVAGTADQKRCSDAKAKLETAQAKVKSTCGSSCG